MAKTEPKPQSKATICDTCVKGKTDCHKANVKDCSAYETVKK
jgi:hypothetical protein